MKKRPFILHNVIFPFPLMPVYYAGAYWGWLIPANYAVDTLIAFLCLRKLNVPDYKHKALKISWVICLMGFLADIIGGMILVLLAFPPGWFQAVFPRFYMQVSLMFRGNNYRTGWGYLVILAVIVLTGFIIYKGDKKILKGITDEKTAVLTAAALAVFTAPYLFFILPVQPF